MSFLDALNSYKKAASSESGAISKKKESTAASYRHPLLDTLAQIKADGTKQTTTIKASSEDSGCSLTLLFIIVDEFPHEAIWRRWLDHGSEASRGKVRVLIHSKFPHRVTSPWVKRHLCKTFQLSPSWGSLELTEVMVRLLEESIQREVDLPPVGSQPSYLEAPTAVKNEDRDGREDNDNGDDKTTGAVEAEILEKTTGEMPENTSVPSSHFAFASESCLPIRTLDDTLLEIEQSYTDSKLPSSWLNYTDKATNGYAQQLQFDKLQGVIPPGCIFKSDQWILLSRHHVKEVLALPSLIETSAASKDGLESEKERGGGGGSSRYKNKMLQLFKRTRASDEMYFPCSLGVLNTLSPAPDGGDGSVRRRQVTYCDWSQGGKNPREYRAAPALFSGDGAAVVENAKAQGCLFMRKVMFPKEAGADTAVGAADRAAFYDAWKGHVLGDKAGDKESEGPEKGHLSRIGEEHQWYKTEQEKERKERDLKRKRQDGDGNRDRGSRDDGSYRFGAGSRGQWGGHGGRGWETGRPPNYNNYGDRRDHYRESGRGGDQHYRDHGAARGDHFYGGGHNSKRYRY